MSAKKQKSGFRRVTLQAELRRIRREMKDPSDRAALAWAIEVAQAQRAAWEEKQYPAIAELIRLFDLKDPRP